MKTVSWSKTLLVAITAVIPAGCNHQPEATLVAASVGAGTPYRAEGDRVPTDFEHAAQWNRADICPKGAELSPFMRYEMDAAEKTAAASHYYARSCNQVVREGAEEGGRKLASASEQSETYYVTPHGPIARWHQNGRMMTEGRYENGTIQGEWKNYRPDGTMIVPSDGLLVAPFGD